MLKDGHLYKNKVDTPKPVWIDLKYNNNNKCGRVLVSFNLFDNDANQSKDKIYKLPKSIQLKSETYFIKIRILGLRDL